MKAARLILLSLAALAWPAFGQPSLPDGTISIAASPGSVAVGQTFTVTCRLSAYNGIEEIDGFAFVISYNPAGLAAVPGSFYLGAASGPDQQFLSKGNQESAANGYALVNLCDTTRPGSAFITIWEQGRNNPERGSAASGGFLVSFQMTALAHGTWQLSPAPYIDDSVLYNTFSRPAGKISFGTASVTVVNPTAVTILAVDSTASEPGVDTGMFRFSRTGPTNASLPVRCTIGGTATSGFDYEMIPWWVMIPAGASNATLAVTPIDDAIVEGDETITLTLQSGSDYAVSGTGTATVTIHDDENPPPFVALTAPAHGAIYPNPTNITLTATASDSNGSVTNVEFFREGTVKIGEDVSSPYSFVWSNAPPGTYVLTARATDNLGATADSVPIGIVVRGPPTVSLTCPTNLAATSSVTVSAAASDPDGLIVFLEIHRDGAVWAATNGGALALAWTNMAPGVYTLTACAGDDRGLLITSAPVVVTVTAAGLSDYYAARPFLGGMTNYATADNTSFTREPGEPTHGYGLGALRTAWVAWTAPRNGNVWVDTFGSSFDTILTLYTNTPPGPDSVSNLFYLGSNNDANGTPQSQVVFTAVAGRTYSLVVGSWAGWEYGAIHLHLWQTNPAPIIAAAPLSVVASVGDNVTFSVSASGTAPLTNQWRWNGTAIAGATGASFTRTNVALTNAGLYDVVVSNGGGAVTSAPAVLVVRAPAEFTALPTHQVVDPGGTATFSVTASGSDPINYQWSFNGVLLPGEITNTFTRYNAAHADGGVYSVSIANAAGSAGAGAELIVRPVFTGWTATNGSLLLNWHGTTGKVYVVEGTTNLNLPSTVWTSLGSVTNTGLQGQFTVPMTNATRLLRLRVGP